MGHDKIYAGMDDDLLFGRLGNDILNGGDDINVLAGGWGNCKFIGELSAEIYIFELGFGQYIIQKRWQWHY